MEVSKIKGLNWQMSEIYHKREKKKGIDKRQRND